MIRNYLDPATLLGQRLTLDAVIKSLADIFRFVRPIHADPTGNYTTLARGGVEVVETTGTAAQTITLSRNHDEGDKVSILWHGTSNVTVDTAGTETINGLNSVDLFSKYHCLNLVKLDDWFIESEYKDGYSNPLYSPILDENGDAITDESGVVIIG